MQKETKDVNSPSVLNKDIDAQIKITINDFIKCQKSVKATGLLIKPNNHFFLSFDGFPSIYLFFHETEGSKY